MDKVNLVLAVLKKHYFWALSAVVVLLALISWAKATSDLVYDFRGRKTKLEGLFTAMRSIGEQPNHPNAAVIQALAAKKDDLEKKVLEAWEILYKQQKANNRLPEVLSEDFKKAFETLKPGEELPPKLLDHYQYFINEHFPKLFDIVEILRPAEDQTKTATPGKPPPSMPRTSTGLGRPGTDVAEGMVGVVAWDEPDRKRIEGRFRWDKTPSTSRVLLAQEDLWVYEALLRVIRNTNGGAKANYDAAVKRIDLLYIGAEVGKLSHETATRSAGSAEDASPSSTGASLLDGRYLDANLNPLRANAPPPYAEFKMMPVRMQLVVQQHKIPKLLVECANSTMPIEVCGVRLWPGAGQPLDVSALSSGAADGESFAATTRAPTRIPSRSESASAGQREGNPRDVPLEIEGIIYIYNPPDKAKLGTGAAGQATPVVPAPAPEESDESTGDETAAAPVTPPAKARAGSMQLAGAARGGR